MLSYQFEHLDFTHMEAMFLVVDAVPITYLYESSCCSKPSYQHMLHFWSTK